MSKGHIIVPQQQEVQIKQDGERVLLIVDGKCVLNLPWDAADALSQAFKIQARNAEEIAKAAGIVEDSALLLRAGIPLGLSSHPKIQDEARKEAAHNRTFRRALPGGIKSQQQFGRPGIRVHPPRKVAP